MSEQNGSQGNGQAHVEASSSYGRTGVLAALDDATERDLNHAQQQMTNMGGRVGKVVDSLIEVWLQQSEQAADRLALATKLFGLQSKLATLRAGLAMIDAMRRPVLDQLPALTGVQRAGALAMLNMYRGQDVEIMVEMGIGRDVAEKVVAAVPGYDDDGGAEQAEQAGRPRLTHARQGRVFVRADRLVGTNGTDCQNGSRAAEEEEAEEPLGKKPAKKKR